MGKKQSTKERALELISKKNESNFSIAVKELIGSKNVNETEAPDAVVSKPTSYSPLSADADLEYRNIPPAPVSRVTMPTPVPQTPKEENFITENTVIHGSITTKSNIRISGLVKGDISSEKDIYITGKIEGNIKGNMVDIKDGVIQGNILAAADVSLNSGAVVIGDLQADNFDSDGKIKGNIKAGSSVSLKGNSVVYGNISSKNINIQDGASISGNVEIISDAKRDDSIFSVDLSAAEKE